MGLCGSTKKAVKSEKVKFFRGLPRFSYGMCTHIGYGPLKDENQDRVGMFDDFGGYKGSQLCFFVADGHGVEGGSIAEMVKKELPRQLLIELPEPVNVKSDEHIDAVLDAMKRAFVNTHKKLLENNTLDSNLSGTTATVCILQGDQIFIAWVGDSSLYFVMHDNMGGYIAKRITTDHQACVPSEKNRVIKAGGRVCPSKNGLGAPRIWLPDKWKPGLMVSRSIGDAVAHTVGCTEIPETKHFTLGEDLAGIAIGSDGVWDVVDPERFAQMTKQGIRDPNKLCREVVEFGLTVWEEKKQADNMSIVYTFFNPPLPKEDAEKPTVINS